MDQRLEHEPGPKSLDSSFAPPIACHPTMTRTFTPIDLVQLPRVDANGAVALASAVEAAAAKFNDLPQNIEESIVQIAADRVVLQQALAKTPPGVLTRKEADRRVDRVAGALHDICEAWATLAEFIPQGEDAKLLSNRIFSDGRQFVNLPVKEEWAAIETKLSTIERENLDVKISAIGASPILALLKQVHAVYGAVIGTTATVDEAPEVRESKDALLDSVRTYVIQVASTVKRGKPETAARAEALQKPLREWVSTSASKEKAEQAGASQGGANAGKSGGAGSSGG
jgi:hypothetical protein